MTEKVIKTKLKEWKKNHSISISMKSMNESLQLQTQDNKISKVTIKIL